MEHLEFYKNKLEFEIDSWDLYVAFEQGIDIVVIDARSVENYDIEHIPGSISIPHRIITKETTSHLDKNKLYITYCDGIGCNASTKSALKLTELGFTVKEMLGGLDWWKRDKYETEGANANSGTKLKCGCS